MQNRRPLVPGKALERVDHLPTTCFAQPVEVASAHFAEGREHVGSKDRVSPPPTVTLVDASAVRRRAGKVHYDAVRGPVANSLLQLVEISVKCSWW